MEIDGLSGLLPAEQLTNNSKPNGEAEQPFTDYLQVIYEKAASQTGEAKTSDDDPEQSDFDFIKEHGMRAYLEKLDADKKEEIREKLLKAMGLTEEDLDNMPAEQRAAIEDRIAEEIERRMAASSEINKDNKNQIKNLGSLTQTLSSRPGIGNGLAMLQALEQQENELSDTNKEEQEAK